MDEIIETAEGRIGLRHDCAEDYHLRDIIYKGRYKEVLKKRFSKAEIKNIPNRFFPERFSIELDINEGEYYSFLDEQGIADYSLGCLLKEISQSPASEGILENLISEIEEGSNPLNL